MEWYTALLFDARRGNLSLAERDIPRIPKYSSEVLVRVKYAGICGTDLHIIQGEFPCKQDGPFALGHEFSGVVLTVGEQVTNVAVNDRVVIDPNRGCQMCRACHSGTPHYCKNGGINNCIGIFKDGGWAEYALIPSTQVHKLPDNITFEQAALCEPLSCLAHGLDRINPISVGQRILILGAGIIGSLWVITLHLQGHRRVTVSEPNSTRLTQIRRLDTGFELMTPDQLKARHEKDEKYKFDLIIDCSGCAPAIESAFGLLDCGGKLCIFGVAPPTSRISISPFDIYMQEASIIGVNINPFSFPKALGLIESLGDRYLNYTKLGIKTFKLQDYEKAINELKKGTIAKAVFKCF